MIEWIKGYMYSYKNINFVSTESMVKEKYAKNYEILPWYQSFLDKVKAVEIIPKFNKIKVAIQQIFRLDI